MKKIIKKTKLRKSRKLRKAQAWGMDLVIAMVLFSMGMVAFYIYSLNQPSEAREKIEEMLYDGKIIANTLLSEGYPEDWNSNNVVRIGILTDNKIDETGNSAENAG